MRLCMPRCIAPIRLHLLAAFQHWLNHLPRVACLAQVEPTAIAALNMNWPGSKLTVHVLDDGKRPEMAQVVRRLAAQCRYMQAGGGRCACFAWCGRAGCCACCSTAQTVRQTVLHWEGVLTMHSGQRIIHSSWRLAVFSSPLVLPLSPLALQREAKIVYVGREKVKGVPHHAKAGNINSCLLKEGPGKVGEDG